MSPSSATLNTDGGGAGARCCGHPSPAGSQIRHRHASPSQRHGPRVDRGYRRRTHAQPRSKMDTIDALASNPDRPTIGGDNGEPAPPPCQPSNGSPGRESHRHMHASQPGRFPTSAARVAPTPLDPRRAFVRWQTPCSWFIFPPEIRNMIYEMLLDLPSCSELYSGVYRQLEAARAEPGAPQERLVPRLGTPAILLLCRAITAEALPVLRARLFVVDRIPPWITGRPTPMMLSEFVGRRTLQALRHIDIHLDVGRGPEGSGWIWHRILDDLLTPLAERTAFYRMRIVIKFFELANHGRWAEESHFVEMIRDKIEWFQENNPQIWKPGEFQLVELEVAPEGIYTLHTLARNLRISDYPNAALVPGSIVDFLHDPITGQW